MEKPVAIHELVLTKSKASNYAFTLHIATSRAMTWVVQEGARYTSDPEYLRTFINSPTPCKKALIVSECFDAHEVYVYLQEGFYAVHPKDSYPTNEKARL